LVKGFHNTEINGNFRGSGKNRGISTHRFTNKNRYIDNGHIDNEVIKFSISPKMDIDMSKNGHKVKKINLQLFRYTEGKK
jgi:hypothetical protein